MLANDDLARKCVEQVECRTDEFQCLMGKCIQGALRCNKRAECPDGSDEIGCPTCVLDELPCFGKNGSICLEKNHLCDGIIDCSGGMDELCCEKDEFRCNNDNCLSIDQLCDGKRDCFDGEDEEHQICFKKVNSTVTSNVKRQFSYSFITLILFSTLVFILYLYKKCRCCKINNDKDLATNDILMTERLTMQGTNCNGNEQKTNGFLNLANGKLDCNTLTTTTTISGLDSLQREAVQLNKMNPINVCQTVPTESLIERNVTGASSTSSSANLNFQINRAINPPPSPATERSQYSSISSSLFVTRPRIRNNNNKNNSVFNNKIRKKCYKKKWNKVSNRGPPPTPCSTDVYDDIDNHCTIKYVFYDNTEMDDYDYKPPPPTPRNYFSEPSCPPSPVTDRSYCNPYPPPPSPVQDYE